MTMLDVIDLSISYGAIEAVKGVSFTVNEGEIVTLIGANGAGKTSILRTISGLNRPKKGDIKFLGESIIHKKPQKNCFQWYLSSSRRSTCIRWFDSA